MTEQQNLSNNPLLKPFVLPPFSAIRPEHIVPAIESVIEDYRQTVEEVVAQSGPFRCRPQPAHAEVRAHWVPCKQGRTWCACERGASTRLAF